MNEIDDENLARETYERMDGLRESPNDTNAEALARWIQESPLHAASYRRRSAIERARGKLARDSDRSLAEWIEFGRKAYGTEESKWEVPRAQEPAEQDGRNGQVRRSQPDELADTGEHAELSEHVPREEISAAPRRRASAAARAAVVALVGTGALAWGWWEHWSWKDYRAVTADVSPRALAEGSSAWLGAKSHIQVRILPWRRDARLLEGGARFHVEHGPERPFRVESATATFEAVGTEFNALRKKDADGVFVIDGLVNIVSGGLQKGRLGPGESADVTVGGHIVVVHGATAGTGAGPQYQMLTLEKIAEEVNRRNLIPQLQIEGRARGKNANISLGFDDPELWVRTLEGSGDFRVVRGDRSVTVSLRGE